MRWDSSGTKRVRVPEGKVDHMGTPQRPRDVVEPRRALSSTFITSFSMDC
jgi:hypothetical protein